MIRCHKRDVKLHTGHLLPKYEALSYVWGSQAESDKTSITINDGEFRVTKTLYAALSRLRYSDRPRTLWIDQICIDQSSAEDKEAQLPLMSKIYSGCTRVLIWLGEIPSDERGISVEDAVAGREILTYLAKRGDYKCPECLSGDEPASATKLWNAMQALKIMSVLENPWWHRIWTVQETALPSSALLSLGPVTLEWSTVYQAARVYFGSGGRTEAPRLIMERIRPIESYETILSNLLRHTLWVCETRRDEPLFMFKRWRRRLATDPRDKVYGLLGLLQEGDGGGSAMSVDCNYHLPAAYTFSSFTQRLIAHENSLRPLVCDPRLESDLATLDIPSWALDLTTFLKYDTDWFQIFTYDKYDTAHGLPELDISALANTAKKSGSMKLGLKGVMVDLIDKVGPGMMVPEKGFRAGAPKRNILQDWSSLLASDSGPKSRYDENKLGKLLLGDWVVDSSQHPMRRTTIQDISSISEFLKTNRTSSELLSTVFAMTKNQRLFKTRKGLLGLGHVDSKKGDEVWVLRGGRVPFILAACEDYVKSETATDVLTYSFVGRCYVEGIMYGEALKQKHPGQVVEQLVELR